MERTTERPRTSGEQGSAPPREEPPDPARQRVGDLMSTAVYAVAEDESVPMAWELLERSGYHHLPVVQPDGRLAGLLDRADLAVVCAAPASSLSGLRVGALLRGRRPASVHAGDTLHRAATVMTYTGADALPVVGEHGHLVGLLTARDIVAGFAGRGTRQPGGERPPLPFPMIPGLPPRRDDRGTAVP